MAKTDPWKLTINGTEHFAYGATPDIGYEQLVFAAFPQIPLDEQSNYKFGVTWLNAWGKTGIVVPGETARISTGINFTVVKYEP